MYYTFSCTDISHQFILKRSDAICRLKREPLKKKSIKVGVSQGSIPAPTLFLIYISDLLHLPKFSESLAYADDTVFINQSNIIKKK